MYINCGTWSLMGIETDHPIINEKSFTHLYANEGGVNNKNKQLDNGKVINEIIKNATEKLMID